MEDNTMKNYVKALILTAMASCLLAGCSGSSDSASQGDGKESYTIGIGQFAAHGSLDNCREGFRRTGWGYGF